MLPGENEISDPLTREQPDTRDALNLSPLMGKPEHPAKGGKLPVDRCRAYRGTAGHYIALYDPFVYPVKPCPCDGRIFEQPIQLRRIELDRLRFVLMAGFHMGNKSLGQVSKHRRGLALFNAHFALRQRGTVCRFDLAGRARVALLCALLNVLPVEEEVIPVDGTAFEN